MLALCWSESACFDDFRGGDARGLPWVAGLCWFGSRSGSEGRCGVTASSCLAFHILVRLNQQVVARSKCQQLPDSGHDDRERPFDGLPGLLAGRPFDGLPGLPAGIIVYAIVSVRSGGT